MMMVMMKKSSNAFGIILPVSFQDRVNVAKNLFLKKISPGESQDVEMHIYFISVS